MSHFHRHLREIDCSLAAVGRPATGYSNGAEFGGGGKSKNSPTYSTKVCFIGSWLHSYYCNQRHERSISSDVFGQFAKFWLICKFLRSVNLGVYISLFASKIGVFHRREMFFCQLCARQRVFSSKWAQKDFGNQCWHFTEEKRGRRRRKLVLEVKDVFGTDDGDCLQFCSTQKRSVSRWKDI